MKPLSFHSSKTRAVAKYIRMSPSKIRRIVRQIQGKTYKEALTLLEFLPYAACQPVIKVLVSAAANAQHNKGIDKVDLVITEAFVDKGPVMKRFRPRAQGRAYRILKMTSHVTIVCEPGTT